MINRGRSFRVLWSVLAVVVLVLSACTTTQSGQGKKGGTFVLGLVAEPTSLDPAQLTDINSMRILSSIYDTLVQFGDNGFDLKPGLATKWTVSPDGLTYTFTLRTGVKFHDGTAFNAAAVKFNFDRMLDPKNEYASTGPFPFGGFYYGSIKETKVVDDSTVQFILSQPYSPLLNSLTLNQGRIVSPDAVKKYGKDFAQHPVGTGPFVFSEWQHGVRVVVTRNDSYWDGAPLLDKIVFRP
ncbi:MAG TPA: ABC transporter substrate-binding protein, partial [Gemmatimonadaceae bacterium]|nr:ABC transporter substrate-binding protein [Gemmatimonadaceae bacterium]